LQYFDVMILFMKNDLEQAKHMKLLLCAFESYQVPRSISIKVNCFVMQKQNRWKANILSYLGVTWANTPLDILEFQFTIRK
jgi:hypothetical protein